MKENQPFTDKVTLCYIVVSVIDTKSKAGFLDTDSKAEIS